MHTLQDLLFRFANFYMLYTLIKLIWEKFSKVKEKTLEDIFLLDDMATEFSVASWA